MRLSIRTLVGFCLLLFCYAPACQKTKKPADQVQVNPKDGAEMVYIPAGEFIMGSNDGNNDEKPQRRVYLDGYWIYKHPVTVKQYRRFCLDTGREMPEAPSWGWKDDHPIVNVTWEDAMAYCKWAGGSLPTEAQWEKAARGTDGRKYPWGNEWDPNRFRAAYRYGLNPSCRYFNYLGFRCAVAGL